MLVQRIGEVLAVSRSVSRRDFQCVFCVVTARLLPFAASEQVWEGFDRFASGGRWAAASPRTPVFSEPFSHLDVLVCFPLLILNRVGEISAVSLLADPSRLLTFAH